MGEVPDPAARSSAASVEDVVVEGPPPTDDPDLADDVAPIAARPGDTACRPGYATTWVPQYQVDKIRRYVPVQKAATRRQSTSTYEYQTAEKTALETAFTGDAGAYAGGFSASMEQDLNVGFNFKAENSQNLVYKVEWYYLQYRKSCNQPFSGGQSYGLRVYNWRPHSLVGGTRVLRSDPTFSCVADNTTTLATETWVARTSTVVYAGWFGIGGVTLDMKQSNSSQHRLTWTPDRGFAPKFCGDNATPFDADRVRERVA